MRTKDTRASEAPPRRISFFSRKTFAVFSAVYLLSSALVLAGFKPALLVVVVGGFAGSTFGLMIYELLLLKNFAYAPAIVDKIAFCALGYFGSLWFIGFAIREIAAQLGHKWTPEQEAAFGRDRVL